MKENEIKIVNPIQIEIEDEKYTLTFNRDSVRHAVNAGLDVDGLSNPTKAAFVMPDLFYFAFRANHKEVTREQADKILYDDLGGLTPELASRLVELFSYPINTIINQTGKVKNPKAVVKF